MRISLFTAALALTATLSAAPALADTASGDIPPPTEAELGSDIWTPELTAAREHYDLIAEQVPLAPFQKSLADLIELTGPDHGLSDAQLGLAQIIMADTLSSIASRTYGSDGYERADALYRSAQELIDRELYPAEWMKARLGEMGEQVSTIDDTATMPEALQLIETIGQMTTEELRETDPLTWARIMVLKGRADSAFFGRYPSEFEHFLASREAFNAALSALSPRDPGQADAWAAAHAELGYLHVLRAGYIGGENIGMSALQELSATEMVWREDTHPMSWAQIMGLRAMAQMFIPDARQNVEDDFKAALAIFNPNDTPKHWFLTKYYQFTWIYQDESRFNDAITVGRELVQSMSPEADDYTRVAIHLMLADSLFDKNVLSGSADDLRDARALLLEAKAISDTMAECDLIPSIEYALARVEDLLGPESMDQAI